ncbi:MAG: DUF2207 domain-containing protein, partial [Roseibacillus sp.]|nr:DUF2207 domain-containing protein [Roseibacillus sp.]
MWRVSLLLFLGLAAMAVSARANERILSWHSEIVVEKSGDLLVTETIKVRAGGGKIKRGIFRDIPLLGDPAPDDKLAHFLRLKKKKPLEVLSVRRKGPEEASSLREENYQVSRIGLGSGGIRIRIGRPDVRLAHGEHTYEIIYRTGRQLYFEEGREALYWNINGTEWDFATDKVSATVELPEGIKPTKVWGYTGRRGEEGKDYEAVRTETGATIATNRVLSRRENLSVVLEWPPGLLDAQAKKHTEFSLGRDHPKVVISGLLLGLAGLYFLLAWLAVGRDPQKGTIIPRYGPPEGLSAAAARYIMEMAYDAKCFSAGVVGLAAKGEATIEKDGKVYVLHPKTLTPAQEGELLELLNEGEAKELEAFKGISMRRAEDIREARPYEKVKDVLRVKGIGKGALAKMINHMSGTGDSPGELLTADETG